MPAVSGIKVVKALSRTGYAVDHQKGSHIVLLKSTPPYNRIVVPNHETVKKGTLRSIIRDAGLTVEEFVGLL